ncbi:NACHT domain-containing protein, partial [Kalaharituber pfeilii]
AAQQRRDILAWLSKLEPEEDLERIYTKRHDGTGTWFFNSPEVKQWYQEDKKCLLWCYGTAGVGKSVLASALLKDIISKHQDNPSIGICFFFFNFQATDTQKPCHLFSLLLKQLCRTQKAIPQGLQAFYTKYYSNDKSPTLLELQHQFVAVSSFFEQVFLVIDAFDECNQDDRKEILNGITRLLQNCSTKLKLCVTSRPEKDIKHAFTSSGFSTIKIEATKVDQDISSFVQHQLQVRTHEHCTLNDEICKEIEHALLLKANGM